MHRGGKKCRQIIYRLPIDAWNCSWSRMFGVACGCMYNVQHDKMKHLKQDNELPAKGNNPMLTPFRSKKYTQKHITWFLNHNVWYKYDWPFKWIWPHLFTTSFLTQSARRFFRLIFFLLFIENDYCYLLFICIYFICPHYFFIVPRSMIRTPLNFTTTCIVIYIFICTMNGWICIAESEKMTQTFIVSVSKLFIIHCIETFMLSSSSIFVIVRLSSGSFYYCWCGIGRAWNVKRHKKKSTQSQLNLNSINEMHFGSIVAYRICYIN